MKTIRVALISFLSLAFAMALPACDDDADDTAETPTEETSAEETAEEQPAEEVAEEPVAEEPAAANEPWRTPPVVDPAVACPDEHWVVITHVRNERVAAVASPVNLAGAIPDAEGNGVTIRLTSMPVEGTSLGYPGPGHVRATLDLSHADGSAVTVGTYRMGTDDNANVVVPRIHAGSAIMFVSNPGTVEITEVTDERICGTVTLDDEYAAIRGTFVAPIIHRE